jgi:hypothetical protein
VGFFLSFFVFSLMSEQCIAARRMIRRSLSWTLLMGLMPRFSFDHPNASARYYDDSWMLVFGYSATQFLECGWVFGGRQAGRKLSYGH